jgi:predicted nuclease of predicted toxin-antitoxin system
LKILLDQNLDRRLKNYLPGHDASTTFEAGWSDLTNGELLSMAERNGYNILLTADANISRQQNMTGRRISIVVRRAPNNRRQTHLEMVDDVLSVLKTIGQGVVEEIYHATFAGKSSPDNS